MGGAAVTSSAAAKVPEEPNRRTKSEVGDEWQTPDDILALGRKALGGDYDLDPASTKAANQRVRAARFFTKEMNGLVRPWDANRLWLNPPFSRGNIEAFVDKFIEQCEAKRMHSGLLLVNAAMDAGWAQRLLARFVICALKRRIIFLDPATGKPRVVFNKKTGKWQRGSNATGQMLVCATHDIKTVLRFIRVLTPHGVILVSPNATLPVTEV